MQTRKGQTGGQDLISLAIAAHERDEKIDDIELFGMVMVLVTGGIGTTSDLISGAIYQMLRRPGLYEQIKRVRSLVSVLLEEILRYDGPIHTLFRVTTTDVEVGGLEIKGAHAGMRRQWRGRPRSSLPQSRRVRSHPRPQRPNRLRRGNPFLRRRRACPGRSPVAIERILERFPCMRLQPGWKPEYTGNAFGRGLMTLPVLLD